jgi:hypothetical protein
VLVLIGRHWVGATNETGQRRLDDPNDFVRLEVAAALKRNIRVIPVLVQHAQMPSPADLPEELKPFASRNGLFVEETHWSADVGTLIAVLEKIVAPAGQEAPPSTQATSAPHIAALMAPHPDHAFVNPSAPDTWDPSASHSEGIVRAHRFDETLSQLRHLMPFFLGGAASLVVLGLLQDRLPNAFALTGISAIVWIAVTHAIFWLTRP